ncbi:hypothetical protein SADUNF_Sadunf11G0095200 [Salix dunnii]|uniref:Uncharacterized protein n=1 Tax=Salix dunnii TaxID=1413687 RepID=A0A835JND9_9ROSI|nr:hypothetical protein SADUNF_Sadunf11G0095200 [Salix dunnii]
MDGGRFGFIHGLLYSVTEADIVSVGSVRPATSMVDCWLDSSVLAAERVRNDGHRSSEVNKALQFLSQKSSRIYQELLVVSPTMEPSTSVIPPVSNSQPSETLYVVPHLPDISIKLASNNYFLWKAQLCDVQDQDSCSSQTITGEDCVSQNNPAAAMWLRTDQLILGWINSSLSDGPLSQVISSETSIPLMVLVVTTSQFHQKDARLSRFTKGSPGTHTQTLTNRGGRSAGHGCGGIITYFRCGDPNYKADGCFASDKEAEQFKAFVALQATDPTKETWYPDTGANNHMTVDTSEVQVRALPRSLQITAVESILTEAIPAIVNTTTRVQSSSSLAHNSALMPQSTPCQESSPNTVIQDALELSSLPTGIISHSAPRRCHFMVTRAQTGSLKPKTFFSSKHPIPACFLADFDNHPYEPQKYKQALNDPK